MQNSMLKKYWKLMPKGFPNDAKLEAKIFDFSSFFKKDEKYEIKEHDFTGSGCLKIHEKSIQNAYKINARKSDAKSMENYAKMEAKGEPKSMQNQKKAEKRHAENQC